MSGLQLNLGGRKFAVDLAKSTDCSVPMLPYRAADAQIEAFHLGAAQAQPVAFGSWVGSVDAGASVNCPTLTCTPHGNGCHTECVGHGLPGKITLFDVGIPVSLAPGVLLSIQPALYEESGELEGAYPSARPGDRVISGPLLQAGLAAVAAQRAVSTGRPEADEMELLCASLRGGALMLRTLPSTEAKLTAKYGGTNPPYLLGSAGKWARDVGVQLLMLDLPSCDREDDGGKLVGHGSFWGLPLEEGQQLPTGLITELCYFRTEEELPAGLYYVNLQVPPIHLDAAPSRVVVYGLEEL